MSSDATKGNARTRRLLSVALPVALALVLPTVATWDSRSGEEQTQVQAGRWSEIKWPFLLDQWGVGRAFRCPAAQCGAELTLYVRPKIGFCNCATGVADDAEVDRVADIELLSPRYAPLGDGRPITVGWMNGRSRAYAVEVARAPRHTVAALAFNDKCDVVVATLVADGTWPAGAEQAGLTFLNSSPMLRWAKAELNQQ
jgi:hypothetical protein